MARPARRSRAAALGALALAAALLLAAAARAQAQVLSGAQDTAALLALRRAIDNWDAFSAAVGLRGWNDSLPTCQWSGVACADDGRVLLL